jgi:hypothetical protein
MADNVDIEGMADLSNSDLIGSPSPMSRRFTGMNEQ